MSASLLILNQNALVDLLHTESQWRLLMHHTEFQLVNLSYKELTFEDYKLVYLRLQRLGVILKLWEEIVSSSLVNGFPYLGRPNTRCNLFYC